MAKLNVRNIRPITKSSYFNCRENDDVAFKFNLAAQLAFFTGCDVTFCWMIQTQKMCQASQSVLPRPWRGPMIWDNFSIFRTNCAIMTSCIRANPRTCRGFSRGFCHVVCSKMVRVASFHSDGRVRNKAEKKNHGSSMHFYALS